jgi:signal transduction histidine kinase
MTAQGRTIERKTELRAGREVPSTCELATPAWFQHPKLFAAYAAHELRAPVTLQRTLVEVTLADPNADVVTLREMGERILASCIRQQHLIEGLLDLARSRRNLTRQEPVDLAAIMTSALRANDLRELGSSVTLERVTTIGDPHLLELLATNLVSNAIRHNLVGGRIEFATRAQSGRAVLRVANTGPLIPASELQRLFQPFQRLAPRPPSTADGVGLGLTIVQAIAGAHDAVVTAHARPRGGLTVLVAFPRPPASGRDHLP